MSRPIHLYVSSSPELYLEREVVGQVAAALPLTIGWRIDHTPLPGEPRPDISGPVGQCDLYVLLLGQDFAAPMGAELREVLALGRKLLAFRKRCSRSPSSQDAVRRLRLEWRVFSEPDDLRMLFLQDLVNAVLDRAARIGLEIGELERLLELSRGAEQRAQAGTGEIRGRGDAGKSGVILGREVWETNPQDPL